MFRVTDERDWQFAFDADMAAFLADGIRRGCAAYAARGGAGILRLHVHGRTTGAKGIWLTPTGNPLAPAVAGVTDEWCELYIAHATRMVQHHENLWALGDQISIVVEQEQKTRGGGAGN